MIDTLDGLDRDLFTILNGFHSPFWDQVMYAISSKIFWVPFYLLLIFLIYRKVGWKSTLLTLVSVGVLITLSDQLTSGLLKPWIERWRPCHPQAGMPNPIHIVNGYCGSKFGFASSHAANFFALATFLAMFFQKKYATLIFFVAATLVAYSRVYLGVHYPGDVLVGGGIGIIFGIIISKLFFRMNKMFTL